MRGISSISGLWFWFLTQSSSIPWNFLGDGSVFVVMRWLWESSWTEAKRPACDLTLGNFSPISYHPGRKEGPETELLAHRAHVISPHKTAQSLGFGAWRLVPSPCWRVASPSSMGTDALVLTTLPDPTWCISICCLSYPLVYPSLHNKLVTLSLGSVSCSSVQVNGRRGARGPYNL